MVRYALLVLVPLLVSCISSSQRFGSRPQNFSEEIIADQLRDISSRWLGCPYKYGGTDYYGVDCSGLVQAVYDELFAIRLPRTTDEQYRSGRFIRKEWIRAGDLLFFKNVRGAGVDHVGIYLGNEAFLHASTSGGVIISRLDDPYYRKHFAGIRRYVDPVNR